MSNCTTFNPLEDNYEDLKRKLNITQGFDVGLEMSGNQSAFSDMVDHMIPGGKIAMLGLFGKQTNTDWNKIIFKGLVIKGIYGRDV